MNATVQRLRVFRETLGAHLPGYVRNILSVLGEMELNIHREEVLKRLTNPNTRHRLTRCVPTMNLGSYSSRDE